MSLVVYLKDIAERIPPNIGTLLSRIPFKMRLGSQYERYYQLAENLESCAPKIRSDYALTSFRKTLLHFHNSSPFYRSLIEGLGNDICEKLSFDVVAQIPVLNKALLKKSSIDQRSIPEYGLKIFNTGGTSGNPLSFFLEKGVYAREWAHMHFLWSKIGYQPLKTKITIRGKALNSLYTYNFNQNEFLINSYQAFDTDDYKKLLQIFSKYRTEFIHGYPSAIYNFLKDMSERAPYLLDFLRKNIKGIMFGSEYPSPYHRNYIEDLLTDNTISWYGHTEAVILAAELYQKYEYVPLLSYGYAEAVKVDQFYHLVGTSFSNLAAPFIRYDTEDLIEPKFNNEGMLSSFQIKEGRSGEFVVDKGNLKISLTALIFGRHHKLFDLAGFIQVKQPKPGQIVIYYSTASEIANPSDFFDSRNVNIDIVFEQIDKPFRTPLGKTPLLIK